jgi:hypothetical protein
MEIGKLLQMIFLSMGQCSPTSETAEILITSVSKTLVEYNQRMKKIKKVVAKNPVSFNLSGYHQTRFNFFS